MTQPHQEFNDDHTPVGYLITFRSYGTWLHGDRRGSVDRSHRIYGTPRLPPNNQRRQYEMRSLADRPAKLDSKQRAAVAKAIRETCTIASGYCGLSTFAQTHVHRVVSANCKPKWILNAFKANATRTMREADCWHSENSPWVRRGSKRYLWTEQQLLAYVECDQGEPLP